MFSWHGQLARAIDARAWACDTFVEHFQIKTALRRIRRPYIFCAHHAENRSRSKHNTCVKVALETRAGCSVHNISLCLRATKACCSICRVRMSTASLARSSSYQRYRLPAWRAWLAWIRSHSTFVGTLRTRCTFWVRLAVGKISQRHVGLRSIHCIVTGMVLQILSGCARNANS